MYCADYWASPGETVRSQVGRCVTRYRDDCDECGQCPVAASASTGMSTYGDLTDVRLDLRSTCVITCVK